MIRMWWGLINCRSLNVPNRLWQIHSAAWSPTAGSCSGESGHSWVDVNTHKRGVWTFAQNQFCWLIFSLWLSVCVYWCWCQIRRVVCRQRHVGLWTEDMVAVWKEQVDTENSTLETNGRTDMCSSSSRQNRTFVSHTMWHCGADPKRECWARTRLLWENQKCELTADRCWFYLTDREDGTGYNWDIMRFGPLDLFEELQSVCHHPVRTVMFHTDRTQMLLQNKVTEWTGPIFPLQ